MPISLGQWRVKIGTFVPRQPKFVDPTPERIVQLLQSLHELLHGGQEGLSTNRERCSEQGNSDEGSSHASDSLLEDGDGVDDVKIREHDSLSEDGEGEKIQEDEGPGKRLAEDGMQCGPPERDGTWSGRDRCVAMIEILQLAWLFGMFRSSSWSLKSSSHLVSMATLPVAVLFGLGILLIRAGDVELNPGPPIPPPEVTHLELSELAEQVIHTDYTKLGLHLGFTDAELQNCAHGKTPPEATKDLLFAWHKRTLDRDQRPQLAKALRTCELVQLEQQILQGSFQELHSNLEKREIEEKIRNCIEDLKEFYTEKLFQIQTDPLDPDSMVELGRIFTNLALLGEDINTKEKTPLLYEDLLTIKINGLLPRRLMVQGEAGVGKTTFLAKIVWDWIKGTHFQQFKLIVVVPLREFQAGVSIGDVLKTYLPDDNDVTAEQWNDYVRMNQRQVLVLLDGYDESAADVSNGDCSDPMLMIMKGKVLTKCQVIVTTRPWKAHHVRLNSELRKHYAFIEIEGFKPENVAEYISRFFTGNEEASQSLIQFIEKGSLIAENMAPYPIYCCMLCHMWKEVERRKVIKKLQTFSQLFAEMIDFLKDHYVAKKCRHLEDEQHKRTKGKLEEHILQIAKVAFEGLMEKTLIFSEDVFDPCKDAVETGCHIGLLTKEKKIAPRGQRKKKLLASSILFPHKLFQEFVAASHLVSLCRKNPVEYDKLMNKIISARDREEFTYLLFFAASQDKNVAMDIIQKLLGSIKEDNVKMGKDTMDVGVKALKDIVDLVFESWDTDVARMVERHFCSLARASELKVDESMSAHTVAGYFMIFQNMECLRFLERRYGHTLSKDLAEKVCSLRTLQRVELNKTAFHDVFYEALAKESSQSKVRSLMLCCFHLETPKGSHNLARGLCQMPSLESVTLKAASFDSQFYCTMAAGSPKIQELHLSELRLYAQAEAQDARSLAKSVCTMPRLKRLVLSNKLELHDVFYSLLAASASSVQIEEVEMSSLDLEWEQRASRDLARSLHAMPCLRSLTMVKKTVLNEAFSSTMLLMSSRETGQNENMPSCNSTNPPSGCYIDNLAIDETTVRSCCGAELGTVFPHLATVTVGFSRTVDPSQLKMLRKSDLKELHLVASLGNRDPAVSDPGALCRALVASFPRLVLLQLSHIALGNERSEFILNTLCESHPSLERIVMVQCHTESGTGEEAQTTRLSERLTTYIQHGKREWL